MTSRFSCVRAIRHLFFLTGLILGSSVFVFAAAGDLDPSFGIQGRQLVTVSTDPIRMIHDNTTDVIVQPDGKILHCGYASLAINPTSGDDFIILRFNTDGTLDSSFASGGIFKYDFDGGSDELRGIALQPDGKIVAAGEVQINPFNPNPNTAFAVIRLNADGSFDATFGTNGLVVTDFMASLDQATEVAIQPDGKIIASGWSTRSNTNQAGLYDFALVRYNPDGSLDGSFGTGGSVFTDFLGQGDLAHTSVLQPDGKIVLAGNVWVNTASEYDFGLARYNPDGTLDAAFGSGGKVITPIGNNQLELVRGMALAPDGKLVVAGDIYNPQNGNVQGNWDFVAVRYNPDGSLDTSFDGDGKFIYATNLGDRSESGGDVIVQPDGKVLLTGKSHLRTESVPGGTVSHTELFVIRLNVNGSFDSSFGNGGITFTDFGIVTPPPDERPRTGDRGEAITLQPDGKIVVAGEATLGNGDWRFVIARYLNDIGPLPTPTPTPASISGTVTYGNSSQLRFVSNVTITAAGSPTVTTTTAAPGPNAGRYTLTGLGSGAYTVTPSKTGGQNGISSFDAAKISQHIAGAPHPSLTGNQLVAADTSNNGSISSFDAALIARYVVSAPSFGTTGNWVFSPASRNYPSVNAEFSDQDFSALLMGEVTGDWNNTGARTVVGGQGSVDSRPSLLAVALPDLVSRAGKDIVVPVSVQGAAGNDIIAYEFVLRYDPAVIMPAANPIDLAGTVSRGFSFAVNAGEPGILRFAAYGAMPISGNGLLLNLRFKTVGVQGSVSPLVLDRIVFNEGDPIITAAEGSVELSQNRRRKRAASLSTTD